MDSYTGVVDHDGQDIEVTVEANSPAEAALKIQHGMRRGDKLSTPTKN
jgi:hypothetical protein